MDRNELTKSNIEANHKYGNFHALDWAQILIRFSRTGKLVESEQLNLRNKNEFRHYSALEEQLQKFGRFGLFNATFILPVITKEIEMDLSANIDVSKPNEDEHEHQPQPQQPKISATFKKRFRDIARDMQRLGYI